MFSDNEKEKVIDPIETGEIDVVELEIVKQELVADEDKKFQFYERLRKKLSGKIPKDGMLNKVTDYLFLLPDFFMLLCRMLVDKRVDNKTKGFIIGVLGYVVLPIDIIPDFIPVIGFMDDLIVVVYAIDQILKHTDEQILLDNWSGKADLILIIRKIMAVIDNTIGQRLLMKVKGFIFRVKK